MFSRAMRSLLSAERETDRSYDVRSSSAGSAPPRADDARRPRRSPQPRRAPRRHWPTRRASINDERRHSPPIEPSRQCSGAQKALDEGASRSPSSPEDERARSDAHRAQRDRTQRDRTQRAPKCPKGAEKCHHRGWQASQATGWAVPGCMCATAAAVLPPLLLRTVGARRRARELDGRAEHTPTNATLEHARIRRQPPKHPAAGEELHGAAHHVR